MPRPATGKVIEHVGKDGLTYRALRFSAYGKRRYVSLGAIAADVADRELRHVLADVERGSWQSPRVLEPPAELEPLPTFHVLAEQWWLRNEGQLAENTKAGYRWRLECHLLPAFGELRIDRIDFDAVERYIASKLAEEEPLSPKSINMTVTLLATILEGAVERGLIDRNPARGKRRRARERRPVRSHLDAAQPIKALMDAAGELDREARADRRHVERRAMLAVLIFAGLRINELCALRWRDVDLAQGWLHTGSKTDAGWRRVKIRGALAEVLDDLRARRAPDRDAFVFATARGGRMSDDNFRARTLRAAVERTNANLARDGVAPLPDKLTPHSLRRTFCSLLYALGEDPGVVMDEMGHTDPGLALRVYRQSMRRGADEKARLQALIEDAELADSGRRATEHSSEVVEREAA